MATATLKTIIERLCDEYGIGRYGTASDGATTSITDDARFGGADGARDLDGGCYVFITYDQGAAAAAPENEETRLSTKAKLSTGVMTLDPALTQAIVASDQYALAYKPFTFKPGSGSHGIIAKINQGLQTFQWEKRTVPITLVTDGDMLAAAETDWTAANATDAKTAASFPQGERVITVTATGDGGYTSTGAIAVEENKSYYLEVLGFASAEAHAGTLVVHDLTNDNPITLDQYVIDRMEPERLVNNVPIPSGCEEVDIRLTCTLADDIVSWANLIFRKNEAMEFTIADRPQKPLWLGNLLVPTGDAWGTRGKWTEIPADLEALDAGLWRYRVKQSLSGQSVWCEEFVAPTTLTNAADTTQIPPDQIAPVAAELLLRPLRTWSKQWAAKYEYAESRAAGALEAYLAQNQTVIHRPQADYPLLRV